MNSKRINLLGAIVILAGINLALVLVSMLSGCASAKDIHAYNRVLTRPVLADKVYRWLETQHPCVTENGLIISGEDIVIHDTTYDSETVDFLNGQIDALLKSKCKNSTPINLDSLRQQIIKEVKRNIKPEYHLRVDTFPKEDIRRLNIAKDSNSYLHGTIDVLTSSVKSETKEKNKWMLLFFGFIGLEVVRIIIKYTKKIDWL